MLEMRVLLCLVVLVAVEATTVVDVLQRYRETTLINLIQQAGLTDALKGAGPFTVFAPTNSAFGRFDAAKLAALQNDTTQLASVLKYHVVSGLFKSSDLLINEKPLPTLNGQSLRVNYYHTTRGLTVEGVPVQRADLVADNGVVHLVSNVVVPPQGSVVDVVSGDDDLSTLLTAVQKAPGVANFLKDQNPITVFAPTNEAFQKLGANVVQFLLNNPDLLTKVLQYHVVPGSLYSTGYHQTYLHTFDEEDKLRLHKFFIFDYEVDSASIKVKDISATNGVVHKIDHVLVPASIKSQLPTPETPTTTAAP